MRRFISLLLILCICVTTGIFFTACKKDDEHTHTYKSKWITDETYHWHECECGETIADKSEHVWDNGKISTSEADGDESIKIFSCSVCGFTKTGKVEHVPDTTVSNATWDKAVEELVAGNFCISINGRNTETTDERSTWVMSHIVKKTVQKIEGSQGNVDFLSYVLIEGDMMVRYDYNYDTSSWEKQELGEYTRPEWIHTYNYASKESGELIIDEVFYPIYLRYTSFQYDEGSGNYVCDKLVLDYPQGAYYGTMSNVQISFVDGKIETITYDFLDGSSPDDVSARIAVTISAKEEDIKVTLPDFD